MTFPTNYVSIHMIKVVSARAMRGNLVVITVKGHYTDTEISLYIEDAEYVARLVTAINDAVNGTSEVAQ